MAYRDRSIRIVFKDNRDDKVKKRKSDISQRLSRSMESVEIIMKHLREYSADTTNSEQSEEQAVLRRVSSSLNVKEDAALRAVRSSERRSASMSNIDLKQFNIDLEDHLRKLKNKVPPSNIITDKDIFVRPINNAEHWKIYKNETGRIFYHNSKTNQSSWKPPRLSKGKSPASTVPEGYIENHDTSGHIYYENSQTKEKWYTALDKERDGSLYFYTHDHVTGMARSEWTLPKIHLTDFSDATAEDEIPDSSIGPHTFHSPVSPHSVNPLDNRKVVKEGVLSWRLKQDKKWSISCIVIYRDQLVLYATAESIKNNKPQFRIILSEAEVDWYCTKSSKQGHRIQLETPSIKLLLKFDNEIDSHTWYQTLVKSITEYKQWLENNRFGHETVDLKTHLGISPPFNVIKNSLENLFITDNNEEKKKNQKLGRKGLSKSFRKMATNFSIRQKKESDEDSIDGDIEMRKNNQLNVKTNDAIRRSLNREPSRRSVYLYKFLQRRATKEELIIQGILKKPPVFGCKLADQKMIEGQTLKIPEFVWKCIEKLESNSDYMSTDGIYRISGDAAKIQKLRIDVDQGNWASFDNCHEVHVLSGSLKLFFRELPEPLLPTYLHHDLTEAAAVNEDEIVKVLGEVLKKLVPVEWDTLKAVCTHLGKVAELDNKMDASNLGLLFGQVLLWPDLNTPVDTKYLLGMN